MQWIYNVDPESLIDEMPHYNIQNIKKVLKTFGGTMAVAERGRITQGIFMETRAPGAITLSAVTLMSADFILEDFLQMKERYPDDTYIVDVPAVVKMVGSTPLSTVYRSDKIPLGVTPLPMSIMPPDDHVESLRLLVCEAKLHSFNITVVGYEESVANEIKERLEKLSYTPARHQYII